MNGYEILHKAWSSIEEVPYCFLRSSVKFQGHTAQKSIDFDPNEAFLDCNSSLYIFTNGYEMMQKALSSIEEVPYCFFWSSIKFQGHTGWKIDDLNPIWVRLLTHWGHICVGNLINIGSENGLAPTRRQATIWTNAGILLIGPQGRNFNEF